MLNCHAVHRPLTASFLLAVVLRGREGNAHVKYNVGSKVT